MKLQAKELEFLSAWAREEKAADPYLLSAHQLQAHYQVKSVTLIRLIKAWAGAEGRRGEEIFHLSNNPNPPWPWSSGQVCLARLEGQLAGKAGLPVFRERFDGDEPKSF
jgi:hypothetical protein